MWAIAIALVGFCTYLGRCITNVYRRRERLFEDLQLFCASTKNDVAFFQLRLNEVFAKACQASGKDLTVLCRHCITAIEGSQGILISRQQIEQLGLLNSADTELLMQFFDSLGKTDSVTQTERLVGFEAVFAEKATLAKQETKSKGILFQRLSPFVGLLLVVLCL